MYASIQSQQFQAFHCCVNKAPIIQTPKYNVYKLVDSEFSTGINEKVNGKDIGVFWHVAIDINGIGYVFDMENNKLGTSVGTCDYLEE